MWAGEFFNLFENNDINFDPEILKLDRIVYAGLWDDEELIKVAAKCKKENKIFVFITTAKMNTDYTPNIKNCFDLLGNHMWIYETRGMVTRVVLNSRAKKYIKVYKNSELYVGS